MTTSEFILGHSVDDLEDRKREAHKIVWAVLAAVALHFVIGFCIALSSGLFSSPIQVEEDKPMEMTLVDLPTPAPVAKNSMFMETDESKASVEKPKEQTFESNANSIGASELPATGEEPLPSQQGKDRSWVDLETHQSSLANKGAQPHPSVAPQQTPQPTVAPTPSPDTEQLAMLTSTPVPSAQPSVQPTVASTPQPPQSVYQPLKEQTHLSGGITNRGPSRINAVGTPLGRYQKIVTDAIGSRWLYYTQQRSDLISIGTLKLSFRIDPSGRVKDIRILSNSSNEAFANVCLQSIIEAQFPPLPEDVVSSLPPEGLEFDNFSFIIYPNS